MIDVFADNLTRKQLIEASKEQVLYDIIVNVNVYRNHAFEPIASVIKPFLNFSKLGVEFNISNYDDSLMFDNFKSGDLELLWIDLENYYHNVFTHIVERVEYLRSISKAPILVILLDVSGKGIISEGLDALKNNLSDILDTHCFLVSEMLCEMHLDIVLDTLKSKITGMRLSNVACISLAQILGLSLIPSLLLPSLKAIVLDLDDTLYSGILSEDGESKLTYNAEFDRLHRLILHYKAQGFLIALASKNVLEDVENLFKNRQDFALSWEDFDLKKISWNPKSQSLKEIAQGFNIGLDSVLFIDDNLAEIESVRGLGVKVLLAKSPLGVERSLRLYPQMLKLRIHEEDALRSKDIQANRIREQFKELSPQEFFERLEMELEFKINIKETLERVESLLNKTNQFIANYTRPTQEEVKKWFVDKNVCVIAIAMKDRLSNSGIIAAFVCVKRDGGIHILDLCISCRALGRKLEKILFFQACRLACESLKSGKDIFITYKEGDRNLPFLEFLQSLQTQKLEDGLLKICYEEVETFGLNLKKG